MLLHSYKYLVWTLPFYCESIYGRIYLERLRFRLDRGSESRCLIDATHRPCLMHLEAQRGCRNASINRLRETRRVIYTQPA